MEFEYIVALIIAFIILILLVIGYGILQAKGIGAIEFLKQILRLGK